MGDISTNFVKQFSGNVEMLVQQKGSVLRNCVRVESGIVGEDAYFDRIGSSAAVLRTTRHGDTPLVDVDHSRRKVSMADYEWASLIDKQDKLKMLLDPASEYVQSAAWALGRAMDDVIITAFGGTAYTGKTGSSSQALTSGQKIAVGATGMNIAKILEAKYILDAADVDPMEMRYMAVTAKQIEDLLNTTEIKSSDYNTVKALAQGQIDTFCGFKFIMCNRLLTDTSDDRLCYAWAQKGLLLGIGQDIKSNITERADKSYAIQPYLSMSLGAVRMQEEKVVQIACDE